MIEELVRAGANPISTIKHSIAETGREGIGCFPIYTPDELVYAAGFLPIGMWGGQTKGTLSDKYLQGFCCSIMKANMEQGLLGKYDFLKGIMITSYCDTLKCVIENWKAAMPHLVTIPVVYPQNRKNDSGKTYFRAELMRIKDKLEELSGKRISEESIDQAIQVYNEFRKAVRSFVDVARKHPSMITPKTRHLIIKASYFMDKKNYTEKITRLIAEMEKQEIEETKGRKIVLTGLMAEPNGLLELLEENDFLVAADDLAQESRQFRNDTPDGIDVYERMAERLGNQDGCAFLYDEEKTRVSLLRKMVAEHEAVGVIVCQLKFCDPEEFDYPLIKKELEEAKIPLLYLELEQQMDSVEQLRTRIQSFAEMLG